MIAYFLGIIGCWLLGDAIYSWTLYANAPTYDDNKKQTLKKDHWVRLVRGILGIALMVMGGYLIGF